MNTKTSTRSKKAQLFNTPAQRQVNAPQRRTTPEPCPISDFESKFGEYQDCEEQITVLLERQKEIKAWAKKEILSVEEEDGLKYIETEDGSMRFSLKRNKKYTYSTFTTAIIKSIEEAKGDLRRAKDGEIQRGEAIEIGSTVVISFKGPKIK